jgi:hypothetical protein
MAPLEATLQQISQVIAANRRTEIFLLSGIGILFGLGIVSAVLVLIKGQYIWSIPAAGSSIFLKWPIERVFQLRNRNIALAAAPIFISQLSPPQRPKRFKRSFSNSSVKIANERQRRYGGRS